MKAAQKKIAFQGGGNPIRHVIYIIKENRTYDQIFGDLGAGNGDPSLTMYGEDITPNLHKLARQFGVLDNFYDSGEVSGDGHVWSNAAITSDYTEKTWQLSYRGQERAYDYEGVVENGYPLLRRHFGHQRAEQRISLDRPGAARQEPLPLWRVHFDPVLRPARTRRRRTGRCPHPGRDAGAEPTLASIRDIRHGRSDPGKTMAAEPARIRGRFR